MEKRVNGSRMQDAGSRRQDGRWQITFGGLWVFTTKARRTRRMDYKLRIGNWGLGIADFGGCIMNVAQVFKPAFDLCEGYPCPDNKENRKLMKLWIYYR